MRINHRAMDWILFILQRLITSSQLINISRWLVIDVCGSRSTRRKHTWPPYPITYMWTTTVEYGDWTRVAAARSECIVNRSTFTWTLAALHTGHRTIMHILNDDLWYEYNLIKMIYSVVASVIILFKDKNCVILVLIFKPYLYIFVHFIHLEVHCVHPIKSTK